MSELERLKEAIWPGLPKWEPTSENSQQHFYEAVAEALHSASEQLVRVRIDCNAPSENDSEFAAELVRRWNLHDRLVEAYGFLVAKYGHAGHEALLAEAKGTK